MANTTVSACDSPFSSSIVLPQLRSSRNGSFTSLSTASRLDKESRAQTLDQIHSSACHTNTLTTFNEFTPPPSASAGVDGKGIASELHGGLSGLYNRLRASVGNVVEIVSHINEDGSPDDRALRDHRLTAATPAQCTRQPADSFKASTASTDSLEITQGSASGRSVPAEKLSPDLQRKEKDQYNKMTTLSAAASGTLSQVPILSSSAPSAPIVPLTQAVPGVAALPAVAEVNVSAIRERDLSGESLPNIPIAISTTPAKPLLFLPSEFLSRGNIEKQDPETAISSVKEIQSGKIQSAQFSRSALDNTPSITARFSDKTAKNRLKNVRRSGVAIDESYGLTDEIITDPIHSPTKPLLGVSKDAFEVSRIVTNPSSPQSDPIVDTQVGHTIGGNSTEPSQKRNHQHLEVSINQSSLPSQSKPIRSPDSYQSQASSEIIATGSLNIARQTLPSGDSGGDMDGSRALATSQPRGPVGSSHHNEAKTVNVYSQIKSKILNKEYWMRDENARDCFYCGDPFSTFRRKHHCST